MAIYLLLIISVSSTFMYYYLHKKTRMNFKFIYVDNLIVIVLTYIISLLAFTYIFADLDIFYKFSLTILIGGTLILGLGYTITMIRFWRTPNRKNSSLQNDILSPADGNVLYIKQIEANEPPIAVKNGILNSLPELTKTTLLKTPCWLIGINMTPWDVHKNCAPIDGKIMLNKHTKGEFLSLKKFESLTQNERNTYIIKNDSIQIGIIQIASKGVRRIDSYVQPDSMVKKGDWLGMIRFGSQVDVIIPYNCKIHIKTGQQIYAAKTIIASL